MDRTAGLLTECRQRLGGSVVRASHASWGKRRAGQQETKAALGVGKVSCKPLPQPQSFEHLRKSRGEGGYTGPAVQPNSSGNRSSGLFSISLHSSPFCPANVPRFTIPLSSTPRHPSLAAGSLLRSFICHSQLCYGRFTIRLRGLVTMLKVSGFLHLHHAYRKATGYGTLLPMRAGGRDPFMKRVLIIED